MKVLLSIFSIAIAFFFAAIFTSSVYAQTTYTYAKVAGFSSLADNSPGVFQFRTPNDLTITRVGSLGAELTASTNQVIFSGSPPESNPAWIVGTRDFYQLAFISDVGSATAVYEFTFSTPLSVSDYLVFVDLDFDEQLKIKAYDANNDLIPYASLTFAKENGNEPVETPSNYISWTAEASYSGVLANILRLSNGDNPVATLRSAVPIKILRYEFNMDPNGSVEKNSIRFNFASALNTTAQPIPTLTEWGMIILSSLLALGAAVSLRRQRQ